MGSCIVFLLHGVLWRRIEDGRRLRGNRNKEENQKIRGYMDIPHNFSPHNILGRPTMTTVRLERKELIGFLMQLEEDGMDCIELIVDDEVEEVGAVDYLGMAPELQRWAFSGMETAIKEKDKAIKGLKERVLNQAKQISNLQKQLKENT